MGLRFLDGDLPDGFVLRRVAVPAGGVLPYVPAEWDGALVVLEAGEIELECRAGGRARLVRGDVVWLAGLPLVALRNVTGEPARLAAVARRPDVPEPLTRRPCPSHTIIR